MIFGTAGHIDHGKSTLVKALTGIDPDRLAEEKARGITLDLGYAYTTLDGHRIGFVDVPGHERLVRNMLAGATGIDRVLLVIAADDGVMPQTREHLAIVSLLGLARGCVALTKIDRVDADRLDAVRAEIAGLLAGSPLADAPIYPVSAADGVGLRALREWLALEACETSERSEPGLFRLPIDRVFSLSGAGLVVTGTVHAGRVGVGDEIVVGPAGVAARVRAVHALGVQAPSARAGDRCSLNLVTDAPRESIVRGHWALAREACVPTTRFDVRLQLLAGETRPLRHWTQVHVHLGAADLSARVAVLNPEEQVAPGGSAFAQIVLEKPTIAALGDRIVLRDQSATRTIGGARVLDIAPPLRRRRVPQRLAILAALENAEPAGRLSAYLEMNPLGESIRTLAGSWGLSASKLATLAQEVDAVSVSIDGDARLFAASVWLGHRQAIEKALAGFHKSNPDEAGIDRDRLRRLVDTSLDRPVFQALVAEGLLAGEIATAGARLRLADHRVVLSPQETRFREQVLPMIAEARFDPPWMRDIARTLRIDERSTKSYLQRLAKAGELFEVVPDLFYSRAAIDALTGIAVDIERLDGVIETPRYRDRVGLGRKRAIQILEYFDRMGVMRRDGDQRWMRPRSALGGKGTDA